MRKINYIIKHFLYKSNSKVKKEYVCSKCSHNWVITSIIKTIQNFVLGEQNIQKPQFWGRISILQC